MPERSPHPALKLRRVASAGEPTKSTFRCRAKRLDADFHAAIIDLSFLPRDLRHQDAKSGDELLDRLRRRQTALGRPGIAAATAPGFGE